MKASHRWLSDLLPGTEMTPEEMAERLAQRGAPVEGISSPGAQLAEVVVGRVLDTGPHPNADRLSVCTVDGGAGQVQVVCGAPNVRKGAWYPFAPVGATLPGGLRIKKAKIRGEVSEGMLCSAKELRLGSDHTGIMEIHGSFTPGAPLVGALGLDDVTLEVEITANRGDLLSHLGLARELAPTGGPGPTLPVIPRGERETRERVRDARRVSVGGVTVEVLAPDLCPRYIAAVVRGVRVGPSPGWLQERVRGAGARPVNNIVDATNFVMLELGQPMHAFDLARLSGSRIVLRRSSAAERSFTTLDGHERALTPDMLMICDADRAVAIAGVMGGADSEVHGDTTDVLLECAWFDPKSIRSTRRTLGMSTDASYRFERGVDREGMQLALERCIEVILATAGGRVEGPVLDCSEPEPEAPLVSLRLSRVERLLGVPFASGRVRELLAPLGFEVTAADGDVMRFRVPGFRTLDVTREVDLIEEIARTHGYDRFPAELGAYRPGTVPDHPLFQLEDRIRRHLVSRGLFEAQTPAFAPSGEGDVRVANPLAATEPFLRNRILPALLRRVSYNLMRGNRDVRLFEIGTSFGKRDKGEPPSETPHLAAVLTGARAPEHWSDTGEQLDLWDLKGLLESIVERIHPEGGRVVEAEGAPLTPFQQGACFEARSGDGSLTGHGGRVRAEEIDTPAWAGPVWGIEIRLPEEPAPEPAMIYDPLPQFPGVERDLALLVPRSVPAGRVLELLRQHGGGWLEAVDVFDLYEGEHLPADVRSIGFRLRFRSREGTLQDDQVDRTVSDLAERLTGTLGVRPRT